MQIRSKHVNPSRAHAIICRCAVKPPERTPVRAASLQFRANRSLTTFKPVADWSRGCGRDRTTAPDYQNSSSLQKRSPALARPRLLPVRDLALPPLTTLHPAPARTGGCQRHVSRLIHSSCSKAFDSFTRAPITALNPVFLLRSDLSRSSVRVVEARDQVTPLK